MPIFNRDGFPWPESIICYHATTALSKILKGGFKPRSEVGIQATGGGTDLAISLTLTHEIADAICIGLDVLRRGAQGTYTARQLYEDVKRICPNGAREGLRYTTEEEHAPATPASLNMIDQGFRGKSFSGILIGELPSDAIPIHTVTVGEREFARTFVHTAWVPIDKDYLGESFARLYKGILTFGDSAKECYDPYFAITHMLDMAKLDPADIGVFVTRVHIPRVCLGPHSAWKSGYLSKDEAARFQSFLDSEHHYCATELEYNAQRKERSKHKMYAQPYKMGEWDVVDEGDRMPEDTMTYLYAMNELRVFAPKRIEILDYYTLADIQRYIRTPVHPWFKTETPRFCEQFCASEDE